MISPAWRIRDAVDADLAIIQMLFDDGDFPDITNVAGIRVAATLDNVIYGALRIEFDREGVANVNPVVVFEVVRGMGVGEALVKDALKMFPELRLVARGHVVGFYEKLGFERCGWEGVDEIYHEECMDCPVLETCGPVPMQAKPVKHTFTFLGTSSGCGVPAFFCHCPSCEAARKDPSLARTCTGAIVQGHSTILIDPNPDLRQQLVREGISDIDETFMTHAHFDHMGGFGELEYLIRLYRDEPLPFHASEYTTQECFKEFSYMDDCFIQDVIGEYETREVDGLTIQALPLNHCPGCFGYLFTTPHGTRTFYAPDTSDLMPEVIEILKGVDNLVMDSTFWPDEKPKTHHTVKQTVDEGINLLGAKHIYLTHLAPHICERNQNVMEEMTEWVKQFDGRVVIAYDGLQFEM